MNSKQVIIGEDEEQINHLKEGRKKERTDFKELKAWWSSTDRSSRNADVEDQDWLLPIHDDDDDFRDEAWCSVAYWSVDCDYLHRTSTMNWAEEDCRSLVHSPNGSDRNESEEDNWICSTETSSVDKQNYSHCWRQAPRLAESSNSMPTTEIERSHSDDWPRDHGHSGDFPLLTGSTRGAGPWAEGLLAEAEAEPLKVDVA